MDSRQVHLHGGRRGAALAIRVTPRAGKNEITGIQSDGTVKVRLAAPPVDGKANEALVELLSDVLGIAKSKIEIVAGASGRDKLVSILDLDAETVQERISKSIA
ncbi:MAG TPA: DUF167 domain-containing protein [Anaerolineales bacterium]